MKHIVVAILFFVCTNSVAHAVILTARVNNAPYAFALHPWGEPGPHIPTGILRDNLTLDVPSTPDKPFWDLELHGDIKPVSGFAILRLNPDWFHFQEVQRVPGGLPLIRDRLLIEFAKIDVIEQGDGWIYHVPFGPIPEPQTYVMLALGLAALWVARMRRQWLGVLLALGCTSAFAQYACTPEQLRDRYKPSVPIKVESASWHINGFSGATPMEAIGKEVARLNARPNVHPTGTCNCHYVDPDRFFCDPVVYSLGCVTQAGGFTAARQVTTSCPPGYSAATFDHGLTNRCASPIAKLKDLEDEHDNNFGERNPDGTTRQYLDYRGQLWVVEEHDVQGRPSVVRNPNGTATHLSWNGERIVTREADNGQGTPVTTRYHYNGNSLVPVAVETAGVAYAVIWWDQYQATASKVETSGGGSVMLGIGESRPPSAPRANARASQSSVGVNAAPAAPLFYVIDFPAVPGPPVFKLGVASFTAGLYVGDQVYPMIEPWLTRVIDACTLSSPTEYIKSRCKQEAGTRMDARLKLCKDQWEQAMQDDPRREPEHKTAFSACEKRARQLFVNESLACDSAAPLYPEVR